MSTLAPVQPAWLAVLASAHAAGELPPYGLVWEDPPPKQSGRYVRRIAHASAGSRIPSHVPIMPSRHRLVVVAYLAGEGSGRWARVYDGSPNNCDALFRLLQQAVGKRRPGGPLPAGRLEVTSRGLGITVALYARYLLDGRSG